MLEISESLYETFERILLINFSSEPPRISQTNDFIDLGFCSILLEIKID